MGRRQLPRLAVPWLLMIGFLGLPSFARGNDTAVAVPPLSRAIDRVLADPGLAQSRIGVIVTDASGEKILFARRADERFILASNVKLVTTACALRFLGTDYELKTRLLRRGPIEDGVVRGDLILQGGGDPYNLARSGGGDPLAHYRRMAAELLRSGVRLVEGGVIPDDRIFAGSAIHPDWPRNQLHKWYCAEVAGLCLNDNCVDVEVRPGDRPGDPGRIRLTPPTGFVEVKNELATTEQRSRHVIRLDRRPNTNQLIVSGRIWTKASPQSYPITIHDPPRFAATVLCETLAASGIDVARGVLDPPSAWPAEDAELVAIHTTPLISVVEVANKRSQNLYAECLFRLAGQAATGEGSISGGCKAVALFLEEIGIPRESCQISDGSGLSRNNRFTPRQIARILARAAASPFADAFINSLSVGGTDGTLKRRFREASVRGRVRAKTGTISGVSTLSGFAESPEGRRIFSILFESNKLSLGRMRTLQDSIARAVVHEKNH